MDKKAIKKILSFVKLLKAPSQMILYVISLVVMLVQRYVDNDKAAAVKVEAQGFVCRKNSSVSGGCGSPAVAVEPDGGVAVVFACSRVVGGVPLYSLCLCRSSDPAKIAVAKREFIFDSPMQLGNVTATATPHGLLISWRSKLASRLHLPAVEDEKYAKTLRERNAESYARLTDDEKQGGTYYALLPYKSVAAVVPQKAPCNFVQRAVMLSDNEILWMGERDGAAVAYVSTDKCKTFTRRGAVPAIPGGRTVSQVSCAKLKNGRLICIFSTMGELFISYSDDMGARWSLPHMLNVRGVSPDLSVRSDGVAVLNYVQPEKKVSVRSMISLDGQYEWLEERALVISTATNCRKPYTVDIGGKFLTVSRQRFAGDRESSVVFTLWSPHKDDEARIKQAAEKSKKKKNN